jgi:hypothetical protein
MSELRYSCVPIWLHCHAKGHMLVGDALGMLSYDSMPIELHQNTVHVKAAREHSCTV